MQFSTSTIIAAAAFFFSLTSAAPADKLQARKGVGAYTNAGQIQNYAAEYACESTGQMAVTKTVANQYGKACDAFLNDNDYNKTVDPIIVQADWVVYNGPKDAGGDGGNEFQKFRWQYATSSAPKLTLDICNDAYKDLTGYYCQGKGTNGLHTQGGTMHIGQKPDVIVIGYDPSPA